MNPAGFDHVIANMFLVPFGMKLGSGVSVGTYIWRSMIPVCTPCTHAKLGAHHSRMLECVGGRDTDGLRRVLACACDSACWSVYGLA